MCYAQLKQMDGGFQLYDDYIEMVKNDFDSSIKTCQVDCSLRRPRRKIGGGIKVSDVVRDIISLNEAHHLLCDHYRKIYP